MGLALVYLALVLNMNGQAISTANQHKFGISEQLINSPWLGVGFGGGRGGDMQKLKIDRPWSEYQMGTKAHSATGGHWGKTKLGWKWCSGATFPRPGGDAVWVTMPQAAKEA